MTDESPVGSRYEREEQIDSGGLATVWRGVDRETGMPVAIKLAHDEVHDREQVQNHFREELRWFRYLAAGPRPGSLVHFVDGSVATDPGYIVTELVEGPSVEETLLGGREAGLETLRAIAPEVCRAIAFLHRNDVLHLDCKPDNVLLRSGDLPAVIDLNSAVERGEGTSTLFYHDPYKPPELTPTELREAPVGPWSDVYALGKFLAFLLTGKNLTFEDESVDAWHAIDVIDWGVDCPGELVGVIERATAPYPADRFSDAEELTAALASAIEASEPTLSLVDEETGRSVRVRPGDSLGRFDDGEPTPAVVLPDEGQYLSPAHATVEYERGEWVLYDGSLNGTFVHDGSDWQCVLSRAGRDRRENADAPLPGDSPVESIRLVDGARIAPVHPDHDVTLTVSLE